MPNPKRFRRDQISLAGTLSARDKWGSFPDQGDQENMITEVNEVSVWYVIY